MLFLPVTRSWSVTPVVTAFDASDIPKKVIILADAPDMHIWRDAFLERGWTVKFIETGNPAPTETERVERRERHLYMRLLSQAYVAGCDRVLFSEDDTLVPTDVWSRLSYLMDCGHTAASGVQRDRHGSELLGVWDYDDKTECFDPLFFLNQGDSSYITHADACGHYCLMTTGHTYATTPLPLDCSVPLDRYHTFQMRPIAVDTGVWCGHLREDGVVL